MKFHPSSIGHIMTDPKTVDESILPDDLKPIAKKLKKTDEEKALLQPYFDMSLSVGAKTYLKNMAKENVYKYYKAVDTKYMEKGLMLENEAIEFINSIRFERYVKNTERKTSEFLTGECDIYVPRVKTIDTKVAWSIDTFPCLSEDAHEQLYEWQGRAYMKLWDVAEHEVVYVLLDTPEELIRYEQRDLHEVSHIPPELRLTSITYQRDMALEAKLDLKCKVAHDYVVKIMDQIKAEHSELN